MALLFTYEFLACFGTLETEHLAIIGAFILSLILLAVCISRHYEHRRGFIRPGEGIADDYRRIAESSGEVFFEFDPLSKAITWTSSLGAGFLGYMPGELTFHEATLMSLIHKDDQEALQKAWDRLKKMERLDMEVRILKKNGQWCWVHMIALPEADKQNRLNRVVGVFRNTQELHETQEELYEARRLEIVGSMAGGIAHEFNNHLTPVHGYIELALDQLEETHAAYKGLVTALDRVEYCSELVAQIQAYGRKSFLLPKPIEITRVLPSVIRVALSTIDENRGRIRIEEQWPPFLPTIWIDQGQFQQAITHLIRNAMQAMPDGGRLTIRAEEIYFDQTRNEEHPDARPGDWIRIRITDTGRGISRENLERVMDPFYTTHEPGSGTGMGLKMVQGMIAQHGGWMEIQSEENKGTEIRLYLPVKRPEAAKESKPKADADGTMSVLPAAPLGRLLIADDEDFMRDIVTRIFEDEGWQVDQANDHAQVLDIVAQDKEYDLFILDLTMPGPPAEETVAEILRTKPRVKVLIISGFARDARIDQLVEMGAVDFLAKPFSPKEIIARVDKMMSATG